MICYVVTPVTSKIGDSWFENLQKYFECLEADQKNLKNMIWDVYLF